MRCCAVLISGFGSNLQALIDARDRNELGGGINLVVSDQADAYGLKRAQKAGIPSRQLHKRDFPDRDAFDAELARILDEYRPDLLVLAGFMRILGAPFVARHRGRILNVHPSLLPKYPGLNTYQRVLAAGDRFHGATVHFVTEALDAGPVVLQYRVSVAQGDTVDGLSARVQAGEHIIFPRAVRWFLTGRLSMDGGQALLDGKPLLEPRMVNGD